MQWINLDIMTDRYHNAKLNYPNWHLSSFPNDSILRVLLFFQTHPFMSI